MYFDSDIILNFIFKLINIKWDYYINDTPEFKTCDVGLLTVYNLIYC